MRCRVCSTALRTAPAEARVKIALIVPGGVDRSGEYRIIPALLALISRLARQHDVHVFALRQEPRPRAGSSPAHVSTTSVQDTPGAGHCRACEPSTVAGRSMSFSRSGPIAAVSLRSSQPHCCACPAPCTSRAASQWPCPTSHTVAAHVARATAREHRHAGRRHRHGCEQTDDRGACATSQRSSPCARSRSRSVASRAAGASCAGIDPTPGARGQPQPREGPADAAARVGASRQGNVAFEADVVGEDTLDGEIQRLARELGLEKRVRFHGFLTPAALGRISRGRSS